MLLLLGSKLGLVLTETITVPTVTLNPGSGVLQAVLLRGGAATTTATMRAAVGRADLPPGPETAAAVARTTATVETATTVVARTTMELLRPLRLLALHLGTRFLRLRVLVAMAAIRVLLLTCLLTVVPPACPRHRLVVSLLQDSRL